MVLFSFAFWILIFSLLYIKNVDFESPPEKIKGVIEVIKTNNFIEFIDNLRKAIFEEYRQLSSKKTYRELMIKKFWGKAFDWSGVINRDDFFSIIVSNFFIYLFLILGTLIYFLLVWLIVNILFFIPQGFTLSLLLYLFPIHIIFPIVYIIYFLFCTLCDLSLYARRLRDIGREPEWMLLMLTGVGSLVLIFWCFRPTKYKSTNPFRL